MTGVRFENGTVYVTVEYDAFSNVNYSGQRTFEYDVEDWNDSDPSDRQAWVAEDFDDWLRTDVDMSVPADTWEINAPVE